MRHSGSSHTRMADWPSWIGSRLALRVLVLLHGAAQLQGTHVACGKCDVQQQRGAMASNASCAAGDASACASMHVADLQVLQVLLSAVVPSPEGRAG